MPLYMDRHDLPGLTAEDVAAAHTKDLEVQGAFGVQYLTYWFDDTRQTAFCLARGPNAQSIADAHRAGHGLVPFQVIEVDEPTVRQFMGGITTHPVGEPYVETAFRVILFTDLEGSTSLTQQVGDAAAMAVLRRHDAAVASALAQTSGSEVKHTGDGIMAAFPSVVGALRAATFIQRTLVTSEDGTPFPLAVRIGIAAGEPVTERNDLFGSTVQLAARLCQRARPGTVLVASAVRDLALGKGFDFVSRGSVRLKGFPEAVRTFELVLPATMDPEPEAATPAAP